VDPTFPPDSESNGERVTLYVNSKLYTEEAIFRAAYLFTGRAYLYLRYESEGCLAVEIAAKPDFPSVGNLPGEFANELINQRIRLSLAQETIPIRQMIVAQAFGEADFES